MSTTPQSTDTYDFLDWLIAEREAKSPGFAAKVDALTKERMKEKKT